MKVQQVQNIQRVIIVDVQNSESDLVVIHLVVLVIDWIQLLYHLQYVDFHSVLTAREEEIEYLTKVRALVSEDTGKILDDILFFKEYVVLLDARLLQANLFKLLGVLDPLLLTL